MTDEPINPNAPATSRSSAGLGDGEKRGTLDPKYVHRCYECGKPLNGAQFCPDCEGSTLRDTQRVDWLESNNRKISIRLATNEKPHPIVCLTVGDDKPEYTGHTVRCAIDAAMKAPLGDSALCDGDEPPQTLKSKQS